MILCLSNGGIMEEWKDVLDYEGIYEVSNLGRVRSKKGKTTMTKIHGVRNWKSRVLKHRGYNNKTGPRVSLWKDGKCKDWLVARLVALAFIKNDKPNMTVNHKDGNRYNNVLSNLEWLTLADNIRHGFETGLFNSNMKNIEVKNQKNEVLSFQSQASFSRYINKTTSYVCSKIKKNKPMYDLSGNTYYVLRRD